MDNIKDVVQQVIGDISSKQPQSQDKLERIWQNILTKQELKHTRLVGVKEGNVSVCVDSPAWLYQMKMKKGKILKRLKDEMSDIKAIRLRVGKI